MDADAMIVTPEPAASRQWMVVLQPLSHPGLAPIAIRDSLFAIGRTEPPFDAYAPEIVAELSRRHARIFCEHGAVYLADLESKNGTRVNGVAVKKAITVLRDGDELGLGSALLYRVQLEEGGPTPRRGARLASLTLTPEHGAPDGKPDGGSALQPIVVAEFPFLIGKAEPSFACYQQDCPQQLSYLSRRHAHLFLKDGAPFVEDLGSTNGTFVGGKRLDEHAVALHDGDLLAFGGHHFVYRLALQWEAPEADPTVTRLGLAPARATPPAPDADKTTFVAAAASFLDIFCVEQAAPEEPPGPPGASPAAPAGLGDAAPARGKAQAFAAELLTAVGAGDALTRQRLLRWSVGVLLLAAGAGWWLYRSGAYEREAQALIGRGAYAQAAVVAGEGLARDPDNARLKSLDTVALLKAHLPAWMAMLKARQFERAAALLTAMRQQGRHNPELAPLLDELGWIASLDAFIAARGGAQAPVRGSADAAGIARIVRQWQDENEAHQRAFATISSYVPAFRDAYADALSEVRKLAQARSPDQNETSTP